MDETTINNLIADPKNPRKISKDDFEKLQKALKKFGDLGGIINNLETGELVGGHKRIEAFKADPNAQANITITQQYEQPTQAGTVAIGYVIVNNEPFGYRVVQWPRPLQRAANLAANHAGGEDDMDLLAEVVYELSQDENAEELLGLTTIDEADLNKLLGQVSGDEDDKYTKEIVTPNYEPNNEKPPVDSLVSHDRTNKLLAEIETAPIDEADKTFLRLAAYRHNVFDYSKIADYYAHSSPEVQNLMENSALIIIDYNKAVELGYVQLTKEMMETQEQDYPNAE